MDFRQEIPSIPIFPIECPPKGSRATRAHGLLLAQSLFQTELPGEDMVRHANRFLEKDLSEIILGDSIQATCINSQSSQVYTIRFTRCYVSPPFVQVPGNGHTDVDLNMCRALRVPYNLGVWVDIQLCTKTYTTIPPLRNFRRRTGSNFFYAPRIFLDAETDDPRDSTTGFVCRCTTKDGAQAVYDQRLEVRFAPSVLADFHEDCKNRQNNNSANPVDTKTYTRQLWSAPARKADREVWKFRNNPNSFHLLTKNLVMIGEYDVESDVFMVKRMGKKSIMRGKVTHTKPPYIEHCEETFEHETVENIPNVLLMQLPCIVGSSICRTRRNTVDPFRYDSSIMHTGTCERVVMRNVDFRTDVCYVKEVKGGKGESVYIGVLRSTHDIRNARRSTSATEVCVTPSSIYLVLPFLTTDTDNSVHIHIVEFVKLMLDEPKTESSNPPSKCTTMEDLLDVLTLRRFFQKDTTSSSSSTTRSASTDELDQMRQTLSSIFTMDTQVVSKLTESRHSILCRMGEVGSRFATKARQIRAILHTLHTECLPHLGVSGTTESRKFKLLHVIRDILHPVLRVYMGKRQVTDIHSLRSKRVNGYADIIGILFRQSFDRYKKAQLGALHQKMRGNVMIDSTIIHAMFNEKRTFENRVGYAFNTGDTTVLKKKGNKSKAEKKRQVSIETIQAINTEGKVGNIRRFHIAHSKKSYSQAQRQLHPSQWHFVCPAEVPEGERCGLVMNFCMGVITSVGYMSLRSALQVSFSVLEEAPGCTVFETLDAAAKYVYTNPLPASSSASCSLLYINHVIVGVLNFAILRDLVLELKRAREHGLFHHEVSIFAHNHDIHIETTRGRLLRPIIRAKFLQNRVFDNTVHACIETGHSIWKTMQEKHIVEFYSGHEIEDDVDIMVVATTFDMYYTNPTKYTHVEVDDLFMYSNTAANSTLQDHNACVRTSYACKHRSQAATGRPMYSDSAPEYTKMELNYPQSPLVESATNRMTYHTMQVNPMTECIFCVISDERACEDGVVVSRGFVERGGMSITKYQEFHAQEKAHHYIRVPQPGTQGIRASNYSKLDPETGIVRPGTKVQFNDVLVGIVHEDTKTGIMSDKSIVYSKQIEGIVTKVESMKTQHKVQSYSIVVQLTGVTTLQVGDKIASPYSQKSVVVAIVPDSDMPEVAMGPQAGLRADIVFENHGLPTRMTCATTDAPLYGLYACKFGKRVNASGFGTSVAESEDMFVKRMGGDGKVWMRNPSTGKLYPNRIFVGCASYMRLNHLVAEKIHARNGGPVDNYMQPTAGKARGGGQRMGKMERTATEGHGAAEFTYERMFLMSDRSIVYVCTTCSSISGEPPLKGQTMGLCRDCNDPQSCRPVEMPYSTIVLFNYMKASGIPVRIRLEPDEDCSVVPQFRDTRFQSSSSADGPGGFPTVTMCTENGDVCVDGIDDVWTSEEEDVDNEWE